MAEPREVDLVEIGVEDLGERVEPLEDLGLLGSEAVGVGQAPGVGGAVFVEGGDRAERHGDLGAVRGQSESWACTVADQVLAAVPVRARVRSSFRLVRC